MSINYKWCNESGIRIMEVLKGQSFLFKVETSSRLFSLLIQGNVGGAMKFCIKSETTWSGCLKNIKLR